jgi:hypothetical protein
VSRTQITGMQFPAMSHTPPGHGPAWGVCTGIVPEQMSAVHGLPSSSASSSAAMTT